MGHFSCVAQVARAGHCLLSIGPKASSHSAVALISHSGEDCLTVGFVAGFARYRESSLPGVCLTVCFVAGFARYRESSFGACRASHGLFCGGVCAGP